MAAEPYLDINGEGLAARGLYESPWHVGLLVWMRDQGMDPTETRGIEVFDGDRPSARVTTYVRGEDGHRVLDEAKNEVATTRETRLVSSLPPLLPA